MDASPWSRDFFGNLGNSIQLAPLIDAIPSAFFFAKDVQGRFTGINQSLLNTLGIDRPEQFIGATDYDFFDRDLADAYRKEDTEVMSSGQPANNRLWWVPNVKTGDIHWYYSTKIPLRDEQGNTIGIAGIMRELENTTELTSEHRLMTRVARHIERHCREKLTLTDLAQVAKLSERQLQRVFKRIFQASPIEHLIRVRVRTAAVQLLETRDSLADIAFDCGFCDQSHFTNQFRRFRGMSPARYRKAYAATSGMS
jgi:AraC-like DNA-binding protein